MANLQEDRMKSMKRAGDPAASAADLAFRAGELFNNRITNVFWSSFKGELGRVQAGVLVHLYDHGTAKAVDIAAELNVPKQHISRIVKEFIADGLVVEMTDPGDRRAKTLSLTEKGCDRFMEHIDVSYRSFYTLLDSMTPKDREDFLKAMEILVRTLGN